MRMTPINTIIINIGFINKNIYYHVSLFVVGHEQYHSSRLHVSQTSNKDLQLQHDPNVMDAVLEFFDTLFVGDFSDAMTTCGY